MCVFMCVCVCVCVFSGEIDQSAAIHVGQAPADGVGNGGYERKSFIAASQVWETEGFHSWLHITGRAQGGSGEYAVVSTLSVII